MSVTNTAAVPRFGGRLKTPEFYKQVNQTISTLRGHTTLKVIAAHLNNMLFTTPSGRPWSKDLLAAYLKSSAFNEKE